MLSKLNLRTLSILFLLASFSVAKADLPQSITDNIQANSPLGTATGKVLIWTIYDAELWTHEKKPFSWNEEFALVLNYRMNFTAEELAKSSIDEIKRMEKKDDPAFPVLEEKLLGCFADVNDDDQFIGYSDGVDTAQFFLNGEKTCDISFPDFRSRFFAIWLGDDTRDNKGSRKLRGVE